MQLPGKQVFKAVVSSVWDLLLDPETLTRIVPEITKPERTGEQTFNQILEIKLGPVNGSFTGNMELEDVVAQRGLTLRVQQCSKIGDVGATVKVQVSPLNDKETDLAFEFVKIKRVAVPADPIFHI